MEPRETPTAAADSPHRPPPIRTPVRPAAHEDVHVEVDEPHADPMAEEAGYGYGV